MTNNNTQIFVVLGIMFLILVAFIIYFSASEPTALEANPEVIQDDITPIMNEQNNNNSANDTINGQVVSGGFELSNAQIEALIDLGVDPDDIPNSISAEQEMCMIEALSEERAQEIKTGDIPSMLEFAQLRSCIL